MGGISDWLTDLETGFLVKRCDISAFAAKIDHLLYDRILRAKMGKKGYEKAKRLYNKEKHIETLMNIFKQDVPA